MRLRLRCRATDWSFGCRGRDEPRPRSCRSSQIAPAISFCSKLIAGLFLQTGAGRRPLRVPNGIPQRADPDQLTSAYKGINVSTPDKFFFGEYRSEEHTSELKSLMRISYAVFCLKKKN